MPIARAKVKAYDGMNLSLEKSGEKRNIKCDSVILAVGYKEEKSLYEELKYDIPEIYAVGDARKVANIMYAVWDAFEIANSI